VEPDPLPPPEVVDYYGRYAEESRLESGPFRLEFERSKEILLRELPKPPARILDVGGAAGAYSRFLADLGYEVHLVDLSPRLVEEARRRDAKRARPVESFTAADARNSAGRRMGFRGLVMGPLYPLPGASIAWRRSESVPRRALRASSWQRPSPATPLSTEWREALPRPTVRLDPQPDLADGQHRNETGNELLHHAYFHRPEDLRLELETAGFRDVSVLGVEGPGWMVPDFDARWDDDAMRSDLLDVARLLEAEPSILGVSAHLLGIGRKLR
jgi:SAM-dependent methyltransferase